AVLEVDVADRALVPGEVDRARALALAEEVLHRWMPRRAAAELDREVDQLQVAVLDDDRQLAELALVATDLDPVVVVAAVDRALAEQRPALRIPRRRARRGRRIRARGRGRGAA